MIAAKIKLNDFLSIEIWYNENLKKIEKTRIIKPTHNENIEKIPQEILFFIENYCRLPSNYLENFLIWNNFTNKQAIVYKKLLNISAGKTITYKQLAELSGIKNGARFVGNCMRENIYPIIIPCHRVVSKTGLGGFTGSPLQTKEQLISWEKEQCTYGI